ncbi:pseudouridine synthase [Xanthobacter sp. TB0139]|uniref:pseudouridine synthase n=1 Tax=Xanthobacter sp. TB0139 TaxID=3459178 RepID=UPI0040392D7D
MSRNLPPRKDKNRVPRQKRELPPAQHKEAERIAKVVARAGLGSRREIEEWILQGRIAVNGKVLESPAFTVTAQDRIMVDGEPLPQKERTRLFLYHKPRGVVTTNRDPEGRPTLFELLPSGLPRLVSVGRLDLNSEGLLLLTNDGGLARVLELPETGWLRRYRARAHGDIDQARLDALMKGISVNGVEYGPIEATLDRVQGSNAWITVSLREGKNREVRNVLGALGLVVNRLIRISYGPFQLGDLPEDGIEEVRTRVLRDQLGEDVTAAAGADFEAPILEREIEEQPAPRPADKAPRHGERGAETGRDKLQLSAPRGRRRMADNNELENRGTVADRRGRSIQVERVVAPKADDTADMAPRSGRPARSGRGFAERDEGQRRFGRFDDKRGEHFARGERPQREGRRWDERGNADERPRHPRGERIGGEHAGGERPRFGAGRKAAGGATRGAEGGAGRRFGARPQSDEDRPQRRDFTRGPRREDDRSSADRPMRERASVERPWSGSSRKDRPAGEAREDFRRGGSRRDERGSGSRTGEGRPFREKREGDRPEGRSFSKPGFKGARSGGPRDGGAGGQNRGKGFGSRPSGGKGDAGNGGPKSGGPRSGGPKGGPRGGRPSGRPGAPRNKG